MTGKKALNYGRSDVKPLRIQADFVIVRPDLVFAPGQIVVDAKQVLEVGRVSQVSPKPDIHLQHHVIAPGLVNAHTHLEFSDLRVPIAAGGTFPEWIGRVIRHRRQAAESLTPAELLVAQRAAVQRGFSECFETGTALAADIVSVPWQPTWLEEVSELSPQPEVLALPEIIGLTEDRFRSTANWATELIGQARRDDLPVCQVGLSPHAPYSLLWEEMQNTLKTLSRAPQVIATHVAESRDELEWLANGTGAFADSFQRLGITGPQSPITRPQIEEVIQFLKQAPRALLVHGNYLSPQQILSLANSRVSVVYCPRTHAHFGHTTYPLKELLAANVRFALGTDSRASTPDLNLWAEVVQARERHQELSAEMAFAAVTNQAAEALGLDSIWGSLEVGRRAFLNVVPCRAQWNRHNLLEELTSTHLVWKPFQPQRPSQPMDDQD